MMMMYIDPYGSNNRALVFGFYESMYYFSPWEQPSMDNMQLNECEEKNRVTYKVKKDSIDKKS